MSCDEVSLTFVNYQLISWIRFLLEELTFTELLHSKQNYINGSKSNSTYPILSQMNPVLFHYLKVHFIMFLSTLGFSQWFFS